MLSIYLSLVDEQSIDDFECIYYEYSKLMYKIAKSYTNDHYLAEEAVQNTFIGIAKTFDKVKKLEKNHLKIYICKATKNSSLSIIAKKNSEFKNLIELNDANENDIFFTTPSEEVVKKELFDLTIDYIRSMKSDYRDIITYYFLYELSLKEISFIMKIPLATVKTKFYRAKKMIQEHFEKYRND